MAWRNGEWRTSRQERLDAEAKWKRTREGERMMASKRGNGDKAGKLEAGPNVCDKCHGVTLPEGYTRCAHCRAKFGAPGRSNDDLSRAIAGEIGSGAKLTSAGTMAGPAKRAAGLMDSWRGEQGPFPGAGQLHNGPSGPPGAQADRVSRPVIEGGCHHNGQTVTFTLTSGQRLYAAQGHKLGLPGVSLGHLGLIVDCAGIVQGRRFVKGSTAPRYRSLNLDAFPDVVTLAWPDMTAPTHVGIRFWERLVSMMPQDTAVCCVGGHGRTGTALASMLVADGATAEDAIKRVRAEHCGRAIETKQQEDYIKGLAAERDKVKAQAQAGKR